MAIASWNLATYDERVTDPRRERAENFVGDSVPSGQISPIGGGAHFIC